MVAHHVRIWSRERGDLAWDPPDTSRHTFKNFQKPQRETPKSQPPESGQRQLSLLLLPACDSGWQEI